MEIKQFTEEEIQKMYENAVRDVVRRRAEQAMSLNGWFKQKTETAVQAELALVLQEVTPKIRAAEKWVKEHLDELIEKKASELVMAAIGGIKRRLENR